MGIQREKCRFPKITNWQGLTSKIDRVGNTVLVSGVAAKNEGFLLLSVSK